jgi:hypothetical protein
MTPQSTFMIMAPVIPTRAAELRRLLASMNHAPGRVNPDNALLPFARFDTLHFARLLILNDPTLADVHLHGLPVPDYPLYFALLGDIDGDESRFLDALARHAHDGLRSLFACCEGFTPATHLRAWMQQQRRPASAAYVNSRGRTLRQVREEATLYAALQHYLTRHAAELAELPAQALHAQLKAFIKVETSIGRLILSPAASTPPDWWLKNSLHLIGLPLLLLLFAPLLIILAPFYLLRLRRLEQTDPAPSIAVEQAYSEALARAEDHDVTNQYSALGSRKPGLVRRLTIIGVLAIIDYAARHLIRPGRLGRIRSIHFARWVLIDDTARLAFFSHYDGSAESYMDDFINKAGFGLNVFSSNGIGYPRTRWLLLDGSADEGRFKAFQRRHTVPTQVWYKAYPGLTAVDLERNTRIRRGLEAATLDDTAARAWLALL